MHHAQMTPVLVALTDVAFGGGAWPCFRLHCRAYGAICLFELASDYVKNVTRNSVAMDVNVSRETKFLMLHQRNVFWTVVLIFLEIKIFTINGEAESSNESDCNFFFEENINAYIYLYINSCI